MADSIELTQPEIFSPELPPKPGEKRKGGRAKGQKNRRTTVRQTVHDKCAEVGIDPIKALARYAANQDPVTGGPAFHYVVKVVKVDGVAEAQSVKVAGHPAEIQFAATKELANYVAPKLKAVEHSSQWGGGANKPPELHVHFISVQKVEPPALNGNTR